MPWISSKDVKTWRVAKGTEFVTSKALAETRLRPCKRGSVLVVVRSGVLAHTLPVAIADADAVVNQDLKVLDCGDVGLNYWLALELKACEREILSRNRKDGTTVQSIRVDELLDLELRVPPANEQRRIIDRVEELLRGVNACLDHLANVPGILRRFRQSVLEAACSGRLTEDWRSSIGIDAPWTENTVGQVTDHIQYGYTAAAKPGGAGPKFLRITDIQNGMVDWSQVPTCAVSSADEAKFRLKAGDILFARTGATTGKSFLIRDVPRAVFASYLIRMRAGKTVLPSFLYLFFQTPVYWSQISGSLSGNAQPGCNATKLSGLTLSVPPLAEQEEIVRRANKLLDFAGVVERRVTRSNMFGETLRQSIIAKAFKGELVPTEAELARVERKDYESAEALLQRIASERECANVAAKLRTRVGR